MNGEKGCTPKEVGERAGSAGQRRAHTISTLFLVSPLGLNSSFSFSRNARLLWSVSWRKKRKKQILSALGALRLQDGDTQQPYGDNTAVQRGVSAVYL